MTKKNIYILFLLLMIIIFMFNNKKEVTISVFVETNDNFIYDNYKIHFKECELNTSNFIAKFLYFNDKDFKILEIIPYIKESSANLFINKNFFYYDNDLYKILDDFKNKYLNIANSENYIANICIKEIKINTSGINIKDFKSKF